MITHGALLAHAVSFLDDTAAIGKTDVQGAIETVLSEIQVRTLAFGLWTSTVSTQALSSVSFTQLNLGTETVNSGHFTINGSNELQVDTDLDYLFTFGKMSAITSSGTRGSSRLTMSYDTGGGYSTADEGRGYLRNATGSTQVTTVCFHAGSSISSGHLVKIEGAITSGTGTTTTTAFGSRLFAIGLSAS